MIALRWLRGERDIPELGRDHKTFQATAYRYADEVVGAAAPESASSPDQNPAGGQALSIDNRT